jgi:deoxycytidylate deaminase
LKNPAQELLQQAAPLHLWELAHKQAQRSPHKRHRTGAVIYYGMGNDRLPTIYSKGCAHPHGGGRRSFSVHAEMDAIARLHGNSGGAVCLVVTLTKGGNFAHSSRPCHNCAKLLEKYVWGVIYAERANDGSWAIRRDSPEDLLRGYLIPTKMNKE